jgi:membrane protease subunit (stomatin/prohibitin family)
LTNLMNWDKLFDSPFKSDVYFFATRLQLDRKWGTPQPVTLRDKDFGAVRLRAFGNYAYRIADPKLFHTSVSGTRERCTVEDLDGPLRGLMLQHISDAVAQSGVPFLDLAANQVEFASQLQTVTAPEFAKLGLALETVTVQNLSLPEELQQVLDLAGNRLGQGKGFYDRVLQQPETLHKKVKRIAVVFDEEIKVSLAAEPHDQKVDAVATASKLVWFNR